jgi:hypothetical protein
VIVLNDKRGSSPSHVTPSGPYIDKRLYEQEHMHRLESFDLGRYARPPMRIGPCPTYSLAQPPLFSPGNSFVNPYLAGSAMSAVTHPHFLQHGARGMLGAHFGPLGPRSRSPLDGPDILQADNRP